MDTITRAATEPAALLRLLAWLSPAFPTGGYAWSHGIEWAVDSGDITDGATLGVWVEDVLRHGAGRNDTILLRHAHRAALLPLPLRERGGVRGWTAPASERGNPSPNPLPHGEAALEYIVELALAAQPSRERRAETVGQGNAFLAAAAAWRPTLLRELADRVGDLPYPVAVGVLAGCQGIAEDDAALALAQAFAANLISAAVRLVPLGQSAGLAVLAGLEATILEVAETTRAATLDDLGGVAFRSDLAAMRHETQYTRLFRS
jgi:urease accessory protein